MKMQRTFPLLNDTLTIVCFPFKVPLPLYHEDYNSFTKTRDERWRKKKKLQHWTNGCLDTSQESTVSYMHLYYTKPNTLITTKMHLATGFTTEAGPEAAVPICGSFVIGGGGENPSVYSPWQSVAVFCWPRLSCFASRQAAVLSEAFPLHVHPGRISGHCKHVAE